MVVRAREPLVLDLPDWLDSGSRAYADVMDAWRTNCPRLTIWEDAVERGLIERKGCRVTLSDAGRLHLHHHR